MAVSIVLPKLVGERVKRREDPRLIQGRGTYVDDLKIAGMQHLAFKRSDVAHGRILSIDVSAALAMEGVEAVFKFFAGECLRLAGEMLPSVRPGIGVEVDRKSVV